MTYSHNTTAFALSLTFDLASIRFKVRPFKLLRTPSPHDHLPRLPILRILSEQSRRFLLGAEQHNRNLIQPPCGVAAMVNAFFLPGAFQIAIGHVSPRRPPCRKLFLTVPAFGDGILSAIASAFGMLVSPDKPLRLSSRWCHVHLLFADLVGILLLPSLVLCRLQLGGHFVRNFYVFIMGVPSVKVLQIGTTFYWL